MNDWNVIEYGEAVVDTTESMSTLVKGHTHTDLLSKAFPLRFKMEKHFNLK